MKGKTAYIVFIAAFFVLCIIPSAGIIVCGESEAAANEILADRPSLFDEEGNFNRSITDDITSYFAERFAFRQELITAYAKINATVFGESVSDDVVLGDDGWLFYSDTVDDWLHSNTMSGRSIAGITRTLMMMQAYAEDCGAKFVFTIAPNKNSLAPADSMMPDAGEVRAEEKNIEKLEAAMSDCGVNYCGLTEVLDTGDDGESLYYRLDSHWNNMGAATAMNALAAALGTASRDWTLEEYKRVKNHRGDLYEMIYPAGEELDEDFEFLRRFGFSYMQDDGSAGTDYYSGDAPADDSINIKTVNENGSGSILMFRDSFGNALYPFVADAFAGAEFSRLMPYRMDRLAGGGYDYIVVEIVERNLEWLAERAPVMPAPQIDAVRAADAGENGVWAEVTEPDELAGYCLVSGTYDPSGIDDDTPVYIDTGSAVYEACPVGAAYGADGTDACFTAYIPAESLSGEFSVMLSSGDKLLRMKCTVMKE